MTLPKVSVIFLSYRQEAFVREALRSVLAQDLPDYEVIIGDDGSPDGTRQILEEEVSAYRGRARVILLPPGPNVGLVRNFNRCAAAASGDIFVAAAGDDVSHPGRLRRVAEFFRRHPECAAHYSNARVIDARGAVSRAAWYRRHDLFIGKFSLKNEHLFQGVQYCGAVASYRAEVFRSFAPMSGISAGEDAPLALRSLILGSAAVDPEILIDWRWHGRNISHGSKKHDLSWRDKLRRTAAWPAGLKMHHRGHCADLEHAEKARLANPETIARFRCLVADMHAQASLKFHCAHPNARWWAICHAARLFWRVSTRSRWWKLRFLAKALGKKLLPGPLRAVVLFNFSNY